MQVQGDINVVGESLLKELLLSNHTSTYPAESRGLIEDQDLIAIGASDTVKNATALIEYGYIYEPKFRDLDIQEDLTKDLAHQTFLGLHRFFGDLETYVQKAVAQTVSYVPHVWSKELKKGMATADVSALQTALTKVGVYSCGVTGTFGPCTEQGVRAFQRKYGITQTGTLGPISRKKLNSLFSS